MLGCSPKSDLDLSGVAPFQSTSESALPETADPPLTPLEFPSSVLQLINPRIPVSFAAPRPPAPKFATPGTHPDSGIHRKKFVLLLVNQGF